MDFKLLTPKTLVIHVFSLAPRGFTKLREARGKNSHQFSSNSIIAVTWLGGVEGVTRGFLQNILNKYSLLGFCLFSLCFFMILLVFVSQMQKKPGVVTVVPPGTV